MIEAFFRYVARALALILEKYADPNLQSRLDAFNVKVIAAEGRAKAAEALQAKAEVEYQAAEVNRRQWEEQTTKSLAEQAVLRTQFEESQRLVSSLENEIATIQKQAEELNAVVRNRSDDDAFSHAPSADL